MLHSLLLWTAPLRRHRIGRLDQIRKPEVHRIPRLPRPRQDLVGILLCADHGGQSRLYAHARLHDLFP